MHFRISFTLSVLFFVTASAGCNGHPQSLNAMLDFASGAAQANNARALYRAIDERSRFAMDSIVADRKSALANIQTYYPADMKASAIAQLGRAAQVRSAQDLFVERCQQECLQEFKRVLAPITLSKVSGDELIVQLESGKTLHVFGPPHARTGFGIVWKKQELDAERTKANRDLKTIAQNVKTYQERKTLESE